MEHPKKTPSTQGKSLDYSKWKQHLQWSESMSSQALIPGLADCVVQSLSTLPPLIQATMLANVLVVGGNAKISGFVERLGDELRSMVKTKVQIKHSAKF